MVQTLTARRFTTDEYDRMIKTGILKKEERVELIRGEIVRMAAIGSRHVAGVARLTTQFSPLAVSGRAIVIVQGPIHLAFDGEPQPDITVIRPRADFYENALPGPGDVLLVVEVVDTSVRYDRNVKIPLYAAAGIPEAWLLVLGRRHLEVYRQPEAGGYRRREILTPSATVAPEAFPDLSIAVRALLG